jgi:hypothetical protein
LGYLKKAPFDKIKIDQSFVRGAAEKGSRNAALIRAIVGMAEGLGMETTAEGAETLEELTLIRQLGCSQVQGHIFGRPMECGDALELAARSRAQAEQAGDSRAPRHGLIRLATLQWGETSLPVRLRNISTGGALLECDRALPQDEAVELHLPGCGRFQADVRWSQSGRLGIRFSQPFDMARLGPTRPQSSSVKVLKPDYLEEAEEALRAVPSRSPLKAKPKKQARRS